MIDADDPLAQLSVPAEPFKKLGKIRGAEVVTEITGDITKQDVVSPVPRDLNRGCGRRGRAVWTCALIGQLIAHRAPWRGHSPARLTVVLR